MHFRFRVFWSFSEDFREIDSQVSWALNPAYSFFLRAPYLFAASQHRFCDSFPRSSLMSLQSWHAFQAGHPRNSFGFRPDVVATHQTFNSFMKVGRPALSLRKVDCRQSQDFSDPFRALNDHRAKKAKLYAEALVRCPITLPLI